MLARIILWLLGLGFIGFGVWAFAAPEHFSNLIQFKLLNAVAVTEMRAFYGGLEFGLGIFFILGATKPDLTRAALVAGAITMTTVASARIIGMLVDSSGGTLLLSVLTLEIVSAAGCMIALRRSA